jgi:hypothetical protein
MCVSSPSAPAPPPPPPPPAPIIPPADVGTRATAAGTAAQRKRTQQAGILGSGSTILTGGLGLTGSSAPAAGKTLLGL